MPPPRIVVRSPAQTPDKPGTESKAPLAGDGECGDEHCDWQNSNTPSPWISLPEDIADRLFYSIHESDQASARLVCRSWAADACKNLCVQGVVKPPDGWGSRFRGIRSVRWQCHSGDPLAADMVELRRLDKLKTLVIEGITEEDMLALESLPSLTSLKLEKCPHVSDAGFEVLHALPNLQFLGMRSCAVSDLEPLRSLTALTRLDLSRSRLISDSSLSAIGPLRGLKSLDLAYCRQLTSSGIEELKSLTSLTWLDLTGCILITDEGLANLRPLSSLASLSLLGCFKITDEGLAALGDLVGLRELDMRCCHKISHRGLRELNSLESLILRGCDGIGDDAAQVIGSTMQSSLTLLDIAYCQRITGAGLNSLMQLSSLKNLHIENCDAISHSGVAQFRECRPNCNIIGRSHPPVLPSFNNDW